MKTKTKKLFLSLFAFAGLALAACSGGGGSSSGSGSSGGGSSGGASGDDSSETEDSSESEEDSSEEEESSEEDPGTKADVYLNVGDVQVDLYVDENYTPGDTADMAAKAKYVSHPTDVYELDTIELDGEVKSGYGFGPNGDGTQRNNVIRPASEPYKVHNDAEEAIFYVYEYDGVEYGNTPGYSFWLTGYVAGSQEEDPTLDGVYLAVSSNDFKADVNHKFSADATDPNHFYFHTTFATSDSFKIYDTSKDVENDRWVTNSDIYTDCGYTLDGDQNIVVSVGGEYYVDYYVNTTNGIHATLYKVVEPVASENVDITLALGEFYTTSNYVYAWAWGNNYGNGQLLSATSTSLTIDKHADGFVLLTSATEITVTDKFPTAVVTQSANINEIPTSGGSTLSYKGNNTEGKGLFTYGNPTAEVTNYLAYERGTAAAVKLELTEYNASEFNIINVLLQVNDLVYFHVDGDHYLKFGEIKSDTDASVKAKFARYDNPGDPSDGNIKVVTAGSFDFYVAKDGSAVYIADHHDVVENHYTLTVGTQVYDLIEGETFIDGDSKEYTQWYAKGVEIAANAIISFHNNDDAIVPALEENAKFSQNATTKVITCTTAGTYDIYLKLRYQDDKLYIGEPVVATDVEYTATGAAWSLDTDGCKVFAWVWGGDTYAGGQWVAATIQADHQTVKVTLKSDATGFKLVRVASSNTSGAWNRDGGAYNGTGDINIASGTTTYNVTWTEIK